MDFGAVIGYVHSALMPLITFVVFLAFTMVRGRRAITSLILGLYLALLISLKFPYYAKVYGVTHSMLPDAIVSTLLFIVFTTISALLMDKLLFYRIDETAFAGFGKKILLALFATILVMAYSYHVLPITNLINPGPSAGFLFASPDYFFWWLLVPLVGLFFI